MSVAPLVTPDYTGTPGFRQTATGRRVLLRGGNVQPHNITSSSLAKLGVIGGNLWRIVVYWDKSEMVAPSGAGANWSSYSHTWDATYLAKVDSVVNYCTTRGIMLVIDWHKTSNWSSYFNPPSTPQGYTSGMPPWYYSDARFPGAQRAYTQDATGRELAKEGWYTGDGDGAVNGSHANQVFAKAFLSMLIARYGSNPNVVLWGLMNEPNPGRLLANQPTYRATSTIINSWLAPLVTHINQADLVAGVYSGRGICGISGIGGHLGWGTMDWSPYGTAAAMRANHVVLETHSYYRGLEPGADASGGGSGLNAVDGPGNHNDYEYPDRTILTTVTADSTAGTQTGQNAFNDVFRNVAAALGLPVLWGEWGVQRGDPARLQYMTQMKTYFDAHDLSCTYWALRNPDQDSLSLLTGANELSDIAVQLQAWLLATTSSSHAARRVVKDASNRVRVTAA